jgi:hypothetical protein
MAIQKVVKIEKFVAAPGGEVLGASMAALPVALKSTEIMPLLERHGFAHIDPEKWYPQQSVLNLYKDIDQGRSNVSDNLVAIGIKSVGVMSFPPEINTMEAVLTAMTGSYAPFHRNIWPGEGTWGKFLGQGHAQITVNVPYPDDVFYGYFWGVAKHYTPNGMRFRIAIVENTDIDMPGTIYDVRWGTDL